ncbi:unnamed protein product [Ceutorhynchus assimilis]|uniref:Uncharacterized protein n=1 Tax=Ceutorhynchus assimilis TaxID=467358 RepID=A0A9N9MY43_9CUCU|nr:unnamed protein product [Ceutorhynchus assimilis]
MGGNFVFGLLLFSVAFAGTQEYVILDEPETDIWDEYLKPNQLLLELCKDYHLTINNNQIDCSNIEFKAKQDNTHIIHRREADDIELEGSGNGESEISLFGENNKDEAAESVEKSDVVKEAANDTVVAVEASNNAQGESDVDPPAAEVVVPSVSESDKVEKVDPPATENVPEVVDAQEIPAVEPPVVESVPEVIDDVQEKSAVDPPAVEVVVPSVTESDKAQEESALKPSESAAVEPEESAVKPSEEKSENVPEESVVVEAVQPEAGLEKVSKPSESDAIGEIVDNVAKETVEEAKEADVALIQPEVIDEKQSGNAILFKEPKTLEANNSPVEGSDSEKHLASLATNEDSKIEQPTTGESAKTVSKASKDTTILIVLFVVVLVIGGAAFTHHMIKMRKAKRAEESSLVDGIRKSLQNLAGNGKAPTPDVEQGTEMKPLMNVDSNSSPVMVKEYSDKKNQLEA